MLTFFGSDLFRSKRCVLKPIFKFDELKSDQQSAKFAMIYK